MDKSRQGRAVERRKNMEELLSHFNIPNVRISAVDGKNLPDDELYSNFIFEEDTKPMKNTEYACLLSHFKAFLLFQKSITEGKNYKNCLILEDDMTLEYAKYWNKPVSTIINEAPKDWEIIMVQYNVRNKIPKSLYTLNVNTATNKENPFCSTGGYIININGVNKILNQIYYNNKFILKKNYLHYADIYIYNLLKTYVYKYPYFIYKTDNDSTISNNSLDTVDFMNNSKKIIFKNTWGKIQDKKIEFFAQLMQYNNIIYIILFILILLLVFIIFKLHK